MVNFSWLEMTTNLCKIYVNIEYIQCISPSHAFFGAGPDLLSGASLRITMHLFYIKTTILVPFGPHKFLIVIRYRFKEKAVNFRLLFILHKTCTSGAKKCSTRRNALYLFFYQAKCIVG